MSRRVELPTPNEVEVLIPDPATDTKRKYRLRVMTRSVKREIGACQVKIDEAQEALPEGEEVATEKQEEAVMRAACDLLNVMLVTNDEDAPSAGNLLYDGWAEDRITDDQIIGLLDGLTKSAEDPT